MLDEFSDTMRSRIVSIFTDAPATARFRCSTWRAATGDGQAFLPYQAGDLGEVRPRDAELHLENVSVPPEVEEAIDKRSSMAAVGNLNDYMKFQMAQGMEKGAGAGGVATEMAVGLAMAQQIVQQQGGASVVAPKLALQRRPPARCRSSVAGRCRESAWRL